MSAAIFGVASHETCPDFAALVRATLVERCELELTALPAVIDRVFFSSSNELEALGSICASVAKQ